MGKVISATLLVITLSTVLAWLAIPQLISSIYLARALPVLEAIRTDKPIDVKTLQATKEILKSRLEWDQSRRALLDIAQLNSHIARNKSLSKAQRKQHILQAQKYIKQALLQAPMDAIAWTRLARIRLSLNETDESVLSALRLGTLLAPQEAGLILWRLKTWMSMIARHAVVLEEDQQLWRQQITQAFYLDAEALYALARRYKLGKIVDQALSTIDLSSAPLTENTNPPR